MEIPILSFKTQAEFRTWLGKNYTLESGIWIRIFKKATGKKTITHLEALDEALCFGWIDAIAHKYDDESYLQKFTPRRKRSMWSKINVGKVKELIKAGKMMPPGLAQIEAAKNDGRWEQAYDSPANMVVPEDFIQELKKDTKTFAFFENLNKANKYAIAFKLQTAKKPETRELRKFKLLEMLKKGEKLY